MIYLNIKLAAVSWPFVKAECYIQGCLVGLEKEYRQNRYCRKMIISNISDYSPGTFDHKHLVSDVSPIT